MHRPGSDSDSGHNLLRNNGSRGPGRMVDVYLVDQFHVQHGLRLLCHSADFGSGKGSVQWWRQPQIQGAELESKCRRFRV